MRSRGLVVDVTPEATEAVCDKILDGFGEQMRAVSLKIVRYCVALSSPVWLGLSCGKVKASARTLPWGVGQGSQRGSYTDMGISRSHRLASTSCAASARTR